MQMQEQFTLKELRVMGSNPISATYSRVAQWQSSSKNKLSDSSCIPFWLNVRENYILMITKRYGFESHHSRKIGVAQW